MRSTRRGIGGNTQSARLVRYDANGTVDATFGGATGVPFDAGSVDAAYTGYVGISVLRGGDILVRQTRTSDANAKTISGIELRRLDPNGAPVTNFGEGGRSFVELIRTRSNDSSSDLSTNVELGAPATFEQPDGKLVLAERQVFSPGFSAARYTTTGAFSGALRLTADGSRDLTFQGGTARYEAPWGGSTSARVEGMDAAGRTVATVTGGVSRSWVVRLLSGDETAPPANVQLHVDERRSCGMSVKRACFDADGAVRITGRVLAAGRPVTDATVVLSANRTEPARGYAPILPVGRTGPDGRFAVKLAPRTLLPGPWSIRAQVQATTKSQRIDNVRPVHVTLGPRSDIELLRRIQRAQALAIALDYAIDDTIEYTAQGVPKGQCTTLDACFGRSAEVMKLVSLTEHPAAAMAGIRFRTPGRYTIVTRADLPQRLEFVLTQSPDETIMVCRGDAATRKRWCPNNEWDDVTQDPYAEAGISGLPFGW